jgi:ketosteroid isomerase-like protein
MRRKEMSKRTTDKEEILKILQKINEAWSKGHPEELAEYFHEDLVILSPTLQRMGEGKEACVKSYKDFLEHADIHEYKERDHMIDVWGKTAVATYAFDISYEMNGQTSRESGHDMFVFNREAEKWLAVWRMVIPSPTKE